MTHDDQLTSAAPSARSNRRLPWGSVAAVSVAALVVGALGYTAGHTALDRAPVGAPKNNGELAGTAPESMPARIAATDLMPYPYERIVFSASGLSDEPGTAEAWTYDPAAVFSRQRADEVADALGIDGEPVLVNGVWQVGPIDGSGPMLQLMPDSMASMSFYDPELVGYACPAEVGGGTLTKQQAQTPPSCGSAGKRAQQDARAIDRVRELMTALDVDAASYEFETDDYGMPGTSNVIAHHVVDGQRTGAVWSVTLTGPQVRAMSASLAPVVSLGTYGVVSSTVAVARLGDARFGVSTLGGPLPYAVASDAADVPVTATVPATPVSPPPAVAPGADFSWPVQQVVITKASLIVAPYTQPNGATVLLPTYELSDDQDRTWTVVAVAGDSLDFDS